MSKVHLKDLRNGIEHNHWIITSEDKGNDYNISGVWIIEKPDNSKKLHLEFEGLGDTEVLELNKSYGCKIREFPNISAYFSKKNRSWRDELNIFLNKLKGLNT